MEYQLRMLLDFQKRKKHSPAARVFLHFPKISQHPLYMDDTILHGKQLLFYKTAYNT
jgi:hypothetical protein